jgi:uncharacterized phiE125 gp8 family phage protein
MVENLSGLKLLDQTWEYSADRFPAHCGWLRLPLAPLLQLVSIVYTDPQGVVQTLDPLTYRIEGIGSVQPARLLPVPHQSWPTTWHGHGAVLIRARYGWPTHNEVPESLRQSIGMLVAHWFDVRATAAAGPDFGPVTPVPFGVEQIIEPYKLWSV